MILLSGESSYIMFNRLTAADYSTGDYYHYEYDAVGNRMSQEQTVGGQHTSDTYGYDNVNRLTNVDGVTYTWDSNGNLLNDGVNTYTYNAANYLTSFTGPSISATYTYNGLGDRLSQTVNGQPINYTLDLNAGLTQVLSDGTNTYYYGVDRIAQKQGGDSQYFLGDALNSVRQLTDVSGVVTLAKSYEPYGELVTRAGNDATTYGFTGEQTDPSLELIYLRSREYDPTTGRFLTKDAWQSDYKKPISYNGWLYGFDNPSRYTDPSGRDPWWCENYSGVNQEQCYANWIGNYTGQKIAYLTFDDGPSVYTIPIALKLQEEGMRATWFVVGTDNPNDWGMDLKTGLYTHWRVNLTCGSDQLPDQEKAKWSGKPIVQYLSSNGHAIGIHAWYHPNDWGAPNAQPSREIKWVEDQLKIDLGVQVLPQKLIRASGGSFGSVPYSGYEGWYYYMWDVNSYDWQVGSAEGSGQQVIDRLYTELEKTNFPDHAVILLHDINPGTFDAIVNKGLLEKFKGWGYKWFFPLPRPSDSPGKVIGTPLN